VSQQKILFIDRDGALLGAAPEGLPAAVLPEPMAIPSLLALQKAGYTLVMLTHPNEAVAAATQQALVSLLSSQGIKFGDILSGPEDDPSTHKPNLGLVKDYLQQGKVDFTASYVIGTSEADIQLAANMGLPGLRYDRQQLSWPAIEAQLTKRGRVASVTRVTKETDIRVTVDLDQPGPNQISTGIGFFDHMLDQIATHGGFQLKLKVQGDLHIDDHHTVEDTALALGEAIRKALGDKRGIGRFGFVLPMDECKASCALDLSGRPYLKFDAPLSRDAVGELATEMVPHFYRSLCDTLMCTLHLEATGENTHHVVESLFKCFGRTLRQAIKVEGDALPSSKGVL